MSRKSHHPLRPPPLHNNRHPPPTEARPLLEKIKALRRQGSSEDQVLGHIKDAFRHADKITRKNIHQLALGLTPRDDISAPEVAGQVEVQEGTQEVELREPREDVEAGAVVFYDGKRWVVASSKGSKLVLKLF